MICNNQEDGDCSGQSSSESAKGYSKLDEPWRKAGSPLGIYFAGNITPPAGYSGTLEWAQIINSLSEWFVFTSGSQQDCAVSNALDRGFPYGNSAPPTANQATTNDSPGEPYYNENVQSANKYAMCHLGRRGFSPARPGWRFCA
jgi:hypothetical protein